MNKDTFGNFILYCETNVVFIFHQLLLLSNDRPDPGDEREHLSVDTWCSGTAHFGSEGHNTELVPGESARVHRGVVHTFSQHQRAPRVSLKRQNNEGVMKLTLHESFPSSPPAHSWVDRSLVPRLEEHRSSLSNGRSTLNCLLLATYTVLESVLFLSRGLPSVYPQPTTLGLVPAWSRPASPSSAAAMAASIGRQTTWQWC